MHGDDRDNSDEELLKPDAIISSAYKTQKLFHDFFTDVKK